MNALSLKRTDNYGYECIELRDFVQRFKKLSLDCILNIYQSQRPVEAIIQSNRLVTTLPSDIFTIVTYDTAIMYEYQRVHSQVSMSSDLGCTLAIHLAHFLIQTLCKVHKRYRNNFYDSLERCCAAANDFLHMITLFEKWIEDFIHSHQLHRDTHRPYFLSLQSQRQELVSIYLQDAVYSAQMAHNFVMQPIQEDLSKYLFTKEWEYPSEPTYVVVTSIIKTLQDFLQDVQIFLASTFLLHKFIDSLMMAMVTFFVHQLLIKAKHIRKSVVVSKNTHRFKNSHRAASQFVNDIVTVQAYFETLIPLSPGLESSIQRHFHPLESICIFINIITSWHHAQTSLPEDILQISHVLHRIAGNVTAKFLRDLTLLFTVSSKLSNKRARKIYHRVRSNLKMIQAYETMDNYCYYSIIDETQSKLPPVLRLDQFLSLFYQRRDLKSFTI